ncbi:bifunctional phosphoribosylaminoimidazolecarboxamide formyltransferase/IMP cyclohydrolase [Phycicoccus sp. MAQZ13P-2]|uniref:bifunctional phosphoribosylaminoimidazolecarboxamide formyltransferase/IMP cyclohydrolase n=1 Tax=Phycicoccus mangrovi TaxID=2840470 RepID=UPI001BFFF667|nr:bifunctional phosphoribosylaminoimidazolecarboxamide formyltransferase/IMP cyclohydrolase [Phycicoccus mangrovi]MBT9257662.1 bifunctional phosphoribosylaminoimidazolecarboxamide formyltransferase/IMP cyclohydrolase [Phycicoccus mangrovi]MBT9276102.1 bifunctional phosphoribosylaminoimidazolecarboxamide formyltransferase/IMP cyclohydrolase [Phycicoccus mangrovi]
MASVSAPGPTQDVRPVRRALVSVYDKTGLPELVQGLHDAGVTLVSTGGSAALIESLGLPVTRVEELTGFPECLEGRVKTLHPRIHAGLLADTRKPDHLAQLEDLGVEAFELVVVNLYPFRETVASGATPDECVEQIDIGGPSMVRAAAKNHPSVAVVTDPAAYGVALEAVRSGGFTLEQRKRLAAEAFAHTASYDVAVASWMGNAYADTSDGTGFPAWTGATWEKSAVLRYGENPHQRAALYTHWRPGLAQSEQLAGKEMSYNNYVDADAALRAAYDHGDQPTVAIIKHANPCGIAVGETVAEAYTAAHDCDPVSAFGGIIATNRPVTREMALATNDVFSEVIVAPAFDDDALEILREKKNRRLLRLPEGVERFSDPVEFRAVSGGVLLQVRDAVDAVVRDDEGAATGGDDAVHWRLVAGDAADERTLADLQFAWRAVRAVKSNAILLARDGASVGIGMGQVNRVDSCHLAVTRAGAQRARGSVAASDAFFPFADGLQVLLDAGVRAVVAPGGSMRDPEVVAAAQAAGVTMYFTGTRHFAH